MATVKQEEGVLEIKSDNPESNLVHQFQCHIIERYQDHIIIFTDGSKDPETGYRSSFRCAGMECPSF